jgi:predicted site-specific integrase-resolvase
MEQQRFKPSEAARILGITPWTMRRWIREGRAPALGSETGRLYIPKQWLDSQLGREIISTEAARRALEQS